MATPLPQISFWVGLLVAGVILVSIVVLAAMCLNCRSKGPLVSIPQGNTSEEYIPSTGFRLIHPYQQTMDLNPPSTHLSPFSPLLDSDPQRPRSFTPTENESIPSYENPADGGDYVNPPEDDSDKEAYIEVLPDLPVVEIRPSSLTSSHSSGSLPRYENPVYGHDYEDPPEDSDKGAYIQVLPDLPSFETRRVPSSQSLASTHSSDVESSYVNVNIAYQEYTNVNPLQDPGATMAGSTDKDSDDDEEDTYVNQPAMIDNQTNALRDRI